ncbi:MAG: acetoacetate--CoA ligase [Deltaproteobacteria bacterium]|nr:acetoacetate--CoA ligase [Deltaproteobacteria bacterium]
MNKMLWSPTEERKKKTNLYRFMQTVNSKFGKNLTEYEPLHQWSVDNIADFWATMWEFADIKFSESYTEVIDELKMPGAKWFQGARLNFAENLLRYRDDHPAIIFKGEIMEPVTITYAELYDEVARLAKSLKAAGVTVGDRVVGFMPNMPQSIMAMLAATSLGATWSSCSPDFGIKGVLDRFGQIKPKILFTANGYSYKGKSIDSLDRIRHILEHIDSIEKVVVVPYTEQEADISDIAQAVHYKDFISHDKDCSLEFEQLPFDHPVYIMYSSGTTGLPKCMVQGAGGILINHLKELILHADLNREDKIFYFTTCGWMMWNWLTSSLAVGATIILFDGQPFYPDASVLWKLAEDVKMTILGTSAAYIGGVKDSGLKPGKEYDLSSLKAVLSTGSPLSIENFEFVYDEVKKDLQLSSISGGTDLNGCFAGGNPMGPVYAGELQCRGLGLNVQAFDSNGEPVVGQQGELVCTLPFPSMPIYFWDDPDGQKYHNAYFDVYPGIWRHGDFIEITETGGVIFLGRSDATLNPGGVRIGTADIYRIIDNIDEIADSVVVGQDWNDDVRVILFVKMAEGSDLTDELKKRVNSLIRTNATPRHMPAKIIAVADIPYTLNMKKVELAVKKIIQDEEVLNKDALINPEALDCYQNLPELQD